MLQLTNKEDAQALATEFNDLRDRVENFRSFNDFSHAVETIIHPKNSALTQFFDDLLRKRFRYKEKVVKKLLP